MTVLLDFLVTLFVGLGLGLFALSCFVAGFVWGGVGLGAMLMTQHWMPGWVDDVLESMPLAPSALVAGGLVLCWPLVLGLCGLWRLFAATVREFRGPDRGL